MVEIPQWMRELDPAKLPPQYRRLSDAIGYDAMLCLVLGHGGELVYVPKLDALIRQARDDKLMSDYRAGIEPSTLAQKYGLSTLYVYALIKEQRKKNAIVGEQQSLFDRDAI